MQIQLADSKFYDSNNASDYKPKVLSSSKNAFQGKCNKHHKKGHKKVGCPLNKSHSGGNNNSNNTSKNGSSSSNRGSEKLKKFKGT